MHQLIQSNYRPDREMNTKIVNVRDRELFSELSSTTRSIRLLVNMVPPFLDENSPMFYLQINGEAVWKRREIYAYPLTVFDLLQRSILPLGHELTASAQARVGNPFAVSIRRFWWTIQAIEDSKRRNQIKAETWVKLAIKPEEIERTPDDVLAQLTKGNGNFRAMVDDKAVEIYEEMGQKLAHTGKDFTDVEKKQQNRHLEQLQ